MSDARAGLDSIKSGLQSLVVEGKTYFFTEKNTTAPTKKTNVFFLPAFDEYTVSYKYRSIVFDPTWHKEAITSNGIFKPIIVVNGLVLGIWKRTVQKNKVLIEPTFFDKKDALPVEVMESAIEGLRAFLGLEVELRSL